MGNVNQPAGLSRLTFSANTDIELIVSIKQKREATAGFPLLFYMVGDERVELPTLAV
jgi:hypothetical protein